MPKSYLLFLFILLQGTVFSQDIVTHKNGSRIYCKIISVDSTFIAYTMPRVKGTMRLRMTEVAGYQWSKNNKTGGGNGNTVATKGAPPALSSKPIAALSVAGGLS